MSQPLSSECYNFATKTYKNIMCMVKYLFAISMIGCLFLSSCSDDNTVFEEPMAIRDYQTDSRILSQFVDIDNTTGTFYINPDKKVTPSDYVFNQNREQLMMVSPLNRSRFESEMDYVNGIISANKKDGNISVILTTIASANVFNSDNSRWTVNKNPKGRESAHNSMVQLSIDNNEASSGLFHFSDGMNMKVSSSNSTPFYISRLTFVSGIDCEEGLILFAGVSMNSIPYTYALNFPDINGRYIQVKGKSMIGNGNLSVIID